MSKRLLFKQLSSYISQIEQEFDLLHSIDHDILNMEKGHELSWTFDKIKKDIKHLFRAERVVLCAYNDKRLVEVGQSPDESGGEYCPSIDIVDYDEPRFQENYPREGENSLFVPIRPDEGMSLMLVVTDRLPADVSILGDRDTLEYAGKLSVQLEILAAKTATEPVQEAKQRLVTDFFATQLVPAKCWQALVDSIADFLPHFSPFRIDPPPNVQLLTYERDDSFLMLRAESNGKRKGHESGPVVAGIAEEYQGFYKSTGMLPLKVDETVSGMLIEMNRDEAVDYIRVDPRSPDVGRRYKQYLFDETPSSELVVAVRDGQGIGAVINLEHMRKDVFKDYHVRLMQECAKYIAPFITALKSRIARQRLKDVGTLYAMSGMLKRMSHLYEHKTGAILSGIRLSMEGIEKEVVGKGLDNDVLERKMDVLKEEVNAIQSRTSQFISDLPDFINYKPTNILSTINAALIEVDINQLREKENIIITRNVSESDSRTEVYASRMLQEHIVNLLQNSLDQIRPLMERREILEGKIDINISRHRTLDLKSEKVEGTPDRIYISIKDNGGGSHPDDFKHIMEFGYTTKRGRGGTGYGLPAAKEYIQSIGGDLKPQNGYPKEFTVLLYLEEYTLGYHDMNKKEL